ncbi:MAG: PG0541 family transporter-associated protein [Spirochaetota bacterium]
MLMMFIVYSNVVDEEVVEIVKRYAGGYTKFIGVQGEGSREPQLGTHVWPGINNCMMVAVRNAKVKDAITEEMQSLKVKFKGVGINIFVLSLKEVL